MSRPIRIVALSAGLSTPSSTRMLADQLTRAARLEVERGGAVADVQTVELRELAHDITDALLTRFASERLANTVDAIRTADAVIAATPVFNVGPSGLFKSYIDAVDVEIWRDKPVLLAATAGTPRHSLAIDYAIRPMLGYLKARVVPTAVFAAASDFGANAPGESEDQPLSARVHRAAGELAAMLQAVGGTPGTGRGDKADAVTETDVADGAEATGADGAEATGADGAEAQAEAETASTTEARGMDAEFADFVPMGKLLGRG